LRLGGLFNKERRERELAEELEAHLQMHITDNLRSGMTPEEARRQALIKLGGIEQTKESYRDRHGVPVLEHLIQDLRYGLRMLRKNPGFTTVAVLTLALGIGANTAIFSVVNTVLLRPLPYKDPGRLMLVLTGNFSKGFSAYGTSPPDFRTLRERNSSFETLSAFYGGAFNLTGKQEAERLQGEIVSYEFFSTLGVKPIVGRTFVASEEQWGLHHVVVVSEPFWRSHLGPNPNLAADTLRLNGEQYTVVGVMPASFRFFGEKQVWVPMAWAPGDVMNTHNNYFLTMVGRLKPGVGRQQAFADLNSIMRGIAERFPENKGIGADLQPLRDALVGDVRPALLVLLGAVGFVLLIACVNIANLLLARGAGRQKESAIRSALGAGRWRLMRQFITESLLLAVSGGAAGLALAYWGLHLLPLVGKGLPRMHEIQIDAWVVAFTFAISVFTGVLFGLVPALQSSRVNLNDSLKEGGRTSGVGGGGHKLRAALVIGEVGLSLVLLIGAGLMIQSFERLMHVDAGFDPRHVLTFEIDMPQSLAPEVGPFDFGAPPRMVGFFNQLVSRIESLPGVEATGVTSALPLRGENWTKFISFADRPAPSSLDQVPQVQYRAVDGHYFRAMGIALLEGRFFNEADGKTAPPVAIVNKALARRFWPNQEPIGKVIWMAPPESLMRQLMPGVMPPGFHFPRQTVVGVVDDVRYGALARDALPVVYGPMAQGDFLLSMFVTVRTQGDPKAVVPSIRTQLAQIDKDQPMANIATMEEILADSVTEPRLESLLLGLFGGLGLALATVGIYGVTSYSVTQRTHEFGIRMALGATHSDVLKMVVKQGMKLAVVGVSIGVAVSLVLTRLMASMLYGVKPTDRLTFALVSLALCVVALLASHIPARRATKVDPMVALRYE
jgi:putative ABC transport system permease protein